MTKRPLLFAVSLLACAAPLFAQTAPTREERKLPDPRHEPSPHHIVYGYAGETAFFFRGKLPVDADGALATYHVGMTCTDGLNDQEHSVVNCAKESVKECASKKGFKSSPHWGAPGTVVQCKVENGACVDGETSTVTCSMTPHANDGLDNLANGGRPGNLYGVVNKRGKLCIVNDDANGGHYVSGTALTRNGASGSHLDACDPQNYVDSASINYIAMPKGMTALGAHLGDIVAIYNADNIRLAYAIIADIGGKEGALGEGSINLAVALGTPSDPKGHRTKPGEKMPADGLSFVVFPGSHKSVTWPLQQTQINAEGAKLLTAWGGLAKLQGATKGLALDPK